MTDRTGPLRSFYEAFARRDAEAMAERYAPGATFRDPVFELVGDDIGDMWRMLIGRGGDLRIDYEIVDDAHVRWSADYSFEGNPVHNEITTEVALDEDGRITRQVDTFDFPRWARQALGWKGKLLGRSAFLHAAVRKASAARLATWQRRRAER